VPRLTATAEEIKGQPAMPEGLYTVRLAEFKPKLSNKKDSVNLNPQLKVTNHAEHNDRNVFEYLNTKAKWVWKDFCHAFGVPITELPNGDIEFPGDFDGPEDDPTKWSYRGPLQGQQAQLYLIQQPATDKNGNPKTDGSVRNAIKYYVCRVPGCQEKHSDNLAKS
jgi:hypothetical protein